MNWNAKINYFWPFWAAWAAKIFFSILLKDPTLFRVLTEKLINIRLRKLSVLALTQSPFYSAISIFAVLRNLVGEIWFQKSGSRNLVQENWFQTSGNSQAIDWVPSSIDLLWFDKFFHIFCFLTNFSEIFSISIYFRGRLNGAVKSDPTLPHSAHFALHSAHFALFFKVFCFSR